MNGSEWSGPTNIEIQTLVCLCVCVCDVAQRQAWFLAFSNTTLEGQRCYILQQTRSVDDGRAGSNVIGTSLTQHVMARQHTPTSPGGFRFFRSVIPADRLKPIKSFQAVPGTVGRHRDWTKACLPRWDFKRTVCVTDRTQRNSCQTTVSVEFL